MPNWRRITRRFPLPGDLDAVVKHLAFARLDQPVDAAKQRRLAGAARAEDDEELARRDVDVDVRSSARTPLL